MLRILFIKCTCTWRVNEWHEYELVKCDLNCPSEGHRIMAGAHTDDGPRGGN